MSRNRNNNPKPRGEPKSNHKKRSRDTKQKIKPASQSYKRSRPPEANARFSDSPYNSHDLKNLEKVFGKHSVRAVFINRPQDIRRMFIAGREEYHTEFITLAEKHDVEVGFLEWSDFREIGEFTEDDRHQGIVIFTKPKVIYGDSDIERLESARCVVLLDQLSNPQNLATIIRCGGFFGVDAILVMKNRAAGLTPTVIRYAVGGAEFIDIFEITNVSRTLSDLKSLGFWTYGLDERGKTTLGRTEFPAQTALVIGAEGEGLRPKTRKYCDTLVKIPGGQKGLESINAAVAASIAMAEIYRMDD